MLYKEFVKKDERIKLLRRTTFYVWLSLFSVMSIILLILWLNENPLHGEEDHVWNEILQGLLIVTALTLATLTPIAPYEYFKRLRKHYKPFDPHKVIYSKKNIDLLHFTGNFAEINLIPSTKVVSPEFVKIVNKLKAWESFRKQKLILAGIIGFLIGIIVLIAADMSTDNTWVNPIYVFFIRSIILLTTTFFGVFLLMSYSSFLDNVETEVDYYHEQIITYLHSLFKTNGVDVNTLAYPLNAYNMNYYRSDAIINQKPATISCVHVETDVWEVTAMKNDSIQTFVSHR